jgi:hypothetical protein
LMLDSWRIFSSFIYCNIFFRIAEDEEVNILETSE